MATFTFNVKPLDLRANTDIFTTSNTTTSQFIFPLANDTLGVQPTIVSAIDTTGFTLGTITIDTITNTRLEFIPNGNIGTSTIQYTIQDNISRTSNSTIIITTTA